MNAFLKFVAKQLFAQKGVIANNKAVNFEAAKLAEKLSEFGIDPNSIKTEKQLEGIINQIKELQKKRMAESMEVISQDDPRFKGIMDKMMGSNVIKRDFGKPFKEEIKKMESEADIAQSITKDNQKGIANIRKKQKMLADAIDDVSPGFANDIKVDAELVAENLAERMGLVYDDLPTKERLDLYDQAYTGLSKQRFKNMPKPDPEEKADGGRIGFKKGMDRRTFMKMVGGLTALPILGKFFKGAEVAAPVAEKAVEAAKTVPPYFLKLAEQIKLLGRQSSGPQERINVYSMKGKDGKSELMLTEDVGTGEMQIKKIGKENDEMVSEVQTMEYTPGKAQADETTKGTPADQYEEYTEYNSRIQKDEFNDPIVEDGINAEDISKEIKDKFDVEQEILEEVARDKKASGGIAMMLGQ